MRPDPTKNRLERVNVAIAVADELRHSLHEVAAACCALGFEHTGTLSDIGVLTGSVLLDTVPRLRDVPGVIAVEIEQPLRTQTLREAPAPITARASLSPT